MRFRIPFILLIYCALLPLLLTKLSGQAVQRPGAPVISVQPVPQSVSASGSATFSVVVTGAAPLLFTWLKNGDPLTVGTSKSLTIPSVTASDAGTYSVRVQNGEGTVTSAAAVLTVGTRPVITTQPVGFSVLAGQKMQFSVTATGTSPLGYQWQKNGTAIAGAAGATYVVNAVGAGDAGSYTVVVSNAFGSVTSAAAVLTVSATPAVGGALTLTTTTSGTGPFTYQWSRNGSAIAGATGSVLSVLYVTPADAGSYTCTARSAQGSVTSGPVSVTVQAGTGTIRLVNTSTRINVGTGDSVLITGMVMEGTGKKSYLIRAVGPALGVFGVTGFLADPELTVYGANGVEQAYNDNWPPALSGIMSGAGAFPMPAGSKDAALVVALSRGAYTFKVSGVGNTSGVALLEIYELP